MNSELKKEGRNSRMLKLIIIWIKEDFLKQIKEHARNDGLTVNINWNKLKINDITCTPKILEEEYKERVDEAEKIGRTISWRSPSYDISNY